MNGGADMIFDALSLGRLSEFQHVLQELEGKGITNLSDARKMLYDHIHAEHVKRQLPEKSIKKTEKRFCPECRGEMELYLRYDAGERLVIEKCIKCQFSRII